MATFYWIPCMPTRNKGSFNPELWLAKRYWQSEIEIAVASVLCRGLSILSLLRNLRLTHKINRFTFNTASNVSLVKGQTDRHRFVQKSGRISDSKKFLNAVEKGAKLFGDKWNNWNETLFDWHKNVFLLIRQHFTATPDIAVCDATTEKRNFFLASKIQRYVKRCESCAVQWMAAFGTILHR